MSFVVAVVAVIIVTVVAVMIVDLNNRQKVCFSRGDPKMKFLRLYLSAVVSPSIRPLKTSPDIVPVLSDV